MCIGSASRELQNLGEKVLRLIKNKFYMVIIISNRTIPWLSGWCGDLPVAVPIIPEYDSKGQLPPGVYRPSLVEFVERYIAGFPSSISREEIFAGYLRYCSMLYQFDIVISNFVDGSYITNKVDPGDVDMVLLIDGPKADRLSPLQRQQFVTEKMAKALYHCDSYVVPVFTEEDQRRPITDYWYEYWKKWFCKDRQNCEKGIIEFDLLSTEYKVQFAAEVAKR